MVKSGIYKIENLINGKVYIGQSINIEERWQSHLRDLRKNKHHNQHLQYSFNKYLECNFTFEIIELCDIEELSTKEYIWMNKYNSYNEHYGYNINLPTNDKRLTNYSLKKNPTDKGYLKEELVSYLQEYYYHFGKVPTQREISSTNGFPNFKTFYERFGSFKNALIESGLYDLVENKKMFNRKEYTKKDVFEAFKVFTDKHNRFPNNKEQRDSIKYNLPTSNIVIKHFKSIENLKKELGYGKEETINKENTKALELLKQLYIQDGKVTARSIDKSKITRSGKFYRDRFGDLAKACELAEVPYALHIL